MSIRRSIHCFIALASLFFGLQLDAAEATGASIDEIGRWRLDESTGTSAIDSIASNTGTYNGGVSLADSGPCGAGDRAVSFDGVDDFLEISHNSDYLLDSGIVSFWLRPADVNEIQDLVSKDSGGFDDGGHLHVWLRRDDLNFRLQNTSTTFSLRVRDVIDANEWHHIVVAWGDGGLRVYLDGVLRDSDPYTGGLGSTSGGSGNEEPFAVGAGTNISGDGTVAPLNDYFEGSIADLRIISGNPSATQIADLGNCSETPTDDAIGRWRLDETSGTVAQDSIRGNDGSYENGVALAVEGFCAGSGPAVELDGVNDYVEVPHNAAYLLDTGSVSLWANPSDVSGNQMLFSKDSGQFDNGGHLTIYMDGDDIMVRMQDTTRSYTLSAANVVQSNRWFNLVFVWGSGGMLLYLDGALVDTDPYSGGLGTTSGGSGNFEPIAIGANTWSSGNEVITPLRDFFAGRMSDVRIYDRALNSSEVDALRSCVLTVAGFELAHDGTGIYCVDEVIALGAIDGSGSLVPSFGGQITLDTQSGSGTWSLLVGNGQFNDSAANDGLATYTFAPADGGTAQFGLSYQEDNGTLNIDAFATADPTVRDIDTEGILQFAPNGFTVTQNRLADPSPAINTDALQTQVAARPFDVHLTAYGQTPEDPTCGVIEDYAGARSVKFWFDYENPGAGTMNPLVDGAAIAQTSAAATSQNVNFVDGRASVSVNYSDAGRIQLLLEDASSFATAISGASNEFVVRPAALIVSQVRSSTGVLTTAATAMSDPGFAAAGEAFTVQVEAVGNTGNLTPNFGLEQVPERVRVTSPALEFPFGGRHGSTGDVNNGSNFLGASTPGRFENSSVTYDEVGIINLQVALVDGDYLGTGAINAPVRSGVGRFYPSSIVLQGGSVGAACGDYTYLSQPELAVTFEMEAHTLVGAPTLNYDATLLGSDNVASVGVVAEDSDSGVDLGARLTGLAGNWIQGRYRVSTPTAGLSRAASVDGPFTALQLGVTANGDPDGVAIADLDMNPTSAGACQPSSCTSRQFGSATLLQYGRLLLLPATGPEAHSLNAPMVAQVFDGLSFIEHSLDNCSTYVSSVTALSDFVGGLAPGDTSVIGPLAITTLTEGRDRTEAPLLLSPPGLGNTGSVRLELDVPAWLEFAWSSSGVVDPSAVYTFGGFRGHDRVVFWRSL